MSLPFGYVYDERMLKHDCPYDKTMAENQARISNIYMKLQQEALLEDAVKIEARPAKDEELLLNHPEELLRELEKLSTSEECEEYCRDKEILWMGPDSEKAARLAAGSAIEMVKANVEGRIGNGFAIVRPPGHHSYGKLPQGYCVFNNVAIAAKMAVEKFGVKKVAIVDFDYHPGNGLFHSLKDDDKFMLCSILAYHHAAFWPFEQDFDYDTNGNQIFVPLNGSMNSEGDYLGIFNHVLIPILKEWQPELILVAAGFDAGYCDIMLNLGQGVKAQGYGHMVKKLNELTPNRVLAILEGGYFPMNYMEAAAMTVRGLKGVPLPRVTHPPRISAPLTETLWNLIIHHSAKFECMREKRAKLEEQQANLGLSPFVQPRKMHLGLGVRELWDDVKAKRAVRTREWFPELSPEQTEININKIKEYIAEYNYSEQGELCEEYLLNQLIWDERAISECFIQTAPVCMAFVRDYRDFIEGKKKNMMICDVELYEV